MRRNGGRGLVALVAAVALAGAVAACDSQAAGFRAGDGAATSAPPSAESAGPGPAPAETGLTEVSPDEGLTEESPTPAPTPTPTPAPGGPVGTSPPADPSPSASDADAMREVCEMSEPFDYWGNADLRTLCEEDYGF
jgi:hypothetical protein